MVAGAGERSRAGQPVEVLLVGTDEAWLHGLHQSFHQRHLLRVLLVQLVVIDDGKFYYFSLSISLLVKREIICVVIS